MNSEEKPNHYPYKLRLIKNRDDDVLIEEKEENNSTYIGEYYPVNYKHYGISRKIYLDISELHSTTSINQNSLTEVLRGKAYFSDYSDSISFFGTDRKLHFINIEIIHCDKENREGFYLNVQEKSNWESDFGKDEECNEEVQVNFCISEKKFSKIKHLIYRKGIKKIKCNFLISDKDFGVKGLYHSTISRIAPFNQYKILLSKEQVINKDELPESFTSIKYFSEFYEKDFSFYIEEEESFKRLNITNEITGSSYLGDKIDDEREDERVKMGYLEQINFSITQILDFRKYYIWILILIFLSLLK